jgi:hypothetical protein
MGTHRPRKAGPFVRSAVNDLRTADQADDRTSIRPNRTTRRPPSGWIEGSSQPGRSAPANPTTSKSVVPFLHHFSCQATAPQRTGRDKNTKQPNKAIYDNASFPRNANAQVQPRHGPHRPLPQHRDPRQSDHLSFPQNDISECQRRAHARQTEIDQPRTIRTINSPFQQNADLSVRSFMHDESWRSSNLSINLTPNLDHTGRPEQRTKQWQTARPRHATNARSRRAVERCPHFVPRERSAKHQGRRTAIDSSRLHRNSRRRVRSIFLSGLAATSLSRLLPSSDRWPCAGSTARPCHPSSPRPSEPEFPTGPSFNLRRRRTVDPLIQASAVR